MTGARKTVLVLGASRYYARSISAARRAGYRVVAVDRDASAAGFAAADVGAVADIVDVAAVRVVAERERADAVVPVNDYGVPTAAAVAAALGLPGISPEAAHLATDKAAMRERWAAAGVPGPRVAVARTREEFAAAVDAIGLPVILKPAHGIGGASRGVVVVRSPDELDAAITFAQSFYTDPTTLVERFIEAEVEHSVEVLVHDGVPHVLAIADKVKSPLPWRVDRTVLYPTALDDARRARVATTACRAVEALGLTVGAAHVELATTRDGCELFELGARCGGGGTPEPIMPWVTGVEAFVEQVRLLAGDAPSALAPRVSRGAAYHFLMPAPGLVASVQGLAEVQAMPGILDAEVFVGAGQRIEEASVGTRRAGFVIASADTREAAHALALQAEAHLVFRYAEAM